MTRWCCLTDYITADREHLQNVVIYPSEVNKEHVKRENEAYHYTRLLLVEEKGNSTPSYMVTRSTRAGNPNKRSVRRINNGIPLARR